MYHQMHCLMGFRQYFNWMLNGSEITPAAIRHVDHCLSYLMMQLMVCGAETTLEPTKITIDVASGRRVHSVAALNVVHGCKDWMQVSLNTHTKIILVLHNWSIICPVAINNYPQADHSHLLCCSYAVLDFVLESQQRPSWSWLSAVDDVMNSLLSGASLWSYPNPMPPSLCIAPPVYWFTIIWPPYATAYTYWLLPFRSPSLQAYHWAHCLSLVYLLRAWVSLDWL